MSHSAIDWDVAPDHGQDPDNQPPTVLPVKRPRPVRHVGVIKLYTPPKAYGYVSGGGCDAIFNIDDVAPADRAWLINGQAVTFRVVQGPDGRIAKEVHIDRTSLPPPPDDGQVLKGWR